MSTYFKITRSDFVHSHIEGRSLSLSINAEGVYLFIAHTKSRFSQRGIPHGARAGGASALSSRKFGVESSCSRDAAECSVRSNARSHEYSDTLSVESLNSETPTPSLPPKTKFPFCPFPGWSYLSVGGPSVIGGSITRIQNSLTSFVIQRQRIEQKLSIWKSFLLK